MLGAIIGAIGSVIGGIGSAAGGIISGLASAGGSLLSGGASVVGGTVSGLASAGGQLLSGGATVAGSLVDVLASKKTGEAAGSVFGIYQMLNPPEQQTVAPASGAAIPVPTRKTNIPTLPGIIRKEQPPEQTILTTPAPAAAKTDYLPLLALGGLGLLIFFKKGK